MVRAARDDENTWSHCVKDHLQKEEVEKGSETVVVDGDRENDGWGIGSVCGGGCLHPCQRRRKRKRRVEMLEWVVVVVGHEGRIDRVCGLRSGMLTSSWKGE
jgi:hypothetical protein